MKIFLQSVASVAFLGVLCGCAPYIVRCHYFYLFPTPQLEVVRKENDFLRESRPLAVATPTIWRLARQSYIVELALGDRWYPQIMADVTSPAGEKLQITSKQFRESRTGEKKQPISLRGHVYRYFASGDDYGTGFLEFEIRDPTGKLLGSEKISFEMRETKSLRFESI